MAVVGLPEKDTIDNPIRYPPAFAVAVDVAAGRYSLVVMTEQQPQVNRLTAPSRDAEQVRLNAFHAWICPAVLNRSSICASVMPMA